MEKRYVSRTELYGYMSSVYVFFMIMFLVPRKELIMPLGCFALILIFLVGVFIERSRA